MLEHENVMRNSTNFSKVQVLTVNVHWNESNPNYAIESDEKPPQLENMLINLQITFMYTKSEGFWLGKHSRSMGTGALLNFSFVYRYSSDWLIVYMGNSEAVPNCVTLFDSQRLASVQPPCESEQNLALECYSYRWNREWFVGRYSLANKNYHSERAHKVLRYVFVISSVFSPQIDSWNFPGSSWSFSRSLSFAN